MSTSEFEKMFKKPGEDDATLFAGEIEDLARWYIDVNFIILGPMLPDELLKIENKFITELDHLNTESEESVVSIQLCGRYGNQNDLDTLKKIVPLISNAVERYEAITKIFKGPEMVLDHTVALFNATYLFR